MMISPISFHLYLALPSFFSTTPLLQENTMLSCTSLSLYFMISSYFWIHTQTECRLKPTPESNHKQNQTKYRIRKSSESDHVQNYTQYRINPRTESTQVQNQPKYRINPTSTASYSQQVSHVLVHNIELDSIHLHNLKLINELSLSSHCGSHLIYCFHRASIYEHLQFCSITAPKLSFHMCLITASSVYLSLHDYSPKVHYKDCLNRASMLISMFTRSQPPSNSSQFIWSSGASASPHPHNDGLQVHLHTCMITACMYMSLCIRQ